VNDWARTLPTYDRVETFRQQLHGFAEDLPPAQQSILAALVARALRAEIGSHLSSLPDDVLALLSELTPVTFSPRLCH
jgi:hypothetical protein